MSFFTVVLSSYSSGDSFIMAKPVQKHYPWTLIPLNDVVKKILNLPGKLDRFVYHPVIPLKWDVTSPLPLGRIKGKELGKVTESGPAGTYESG